jgi:hypothetical protein
MRLTTTKPKKLTEGQKQALARKAGKAHPMVQSTRKMAGETAKDWSDREKLAFLEWPDGTYFGNRTGLSEFNGYEALLRDTKGGNWDEWPADLRVRDFPGTANGTHGSMAERDGVNANV